MNATRTHRSRDVQDHLASSTAVRAGAPSGLPQPPAGDPVFFGRSSMSPFLSRRSDHCVILDGVLWPTLQHYVEAAPFRDSRHIAMIRAAPQAGGAEQLARNLRHVPRWEASDEARRAIMRTALWAKFVQHSTLAARLLETGDRPLIELGPDPFWSTGPDGGGQNWAGVLLGDVRTALRAQAMPMGWATGEGLPDHAVVFADSAVVVPNGPAARLAVRAWSILTSPLPQTAPLTLTDTATSGRVLQVRLLGRAGAQMYLRWSGPDPRSLTGDRMRARVLVAMSAAATDSIIWVHDRRRPRPPGPHPPAAGAPAPP